MAGISLEEILKLPILKESKVLTGENNLNSYVSGIAVAEVPDIVNLAKKHTIYLSTLFAFKDDTSLKSLIYGLKNKKAAALFIKPKRFFNKVPEALIQAGKEIDFPIVEVKEDIMWSDLMRAVLEKIIEAESYQKVERGFLQSLIEGNIREEDEELWKSYLKIEKNDFFVLGVLQEKTNKENEILSFEESERVAYEIRSAFSKLGVRALVAGIGKRYLILATMPKDFEEKIISGISNELRKRITSNFYLILSKRFSKLSDAYLNFRKCLKLLEIAKNLKIINTLILEENFEEDLLIMELINSQYAETLINNLLRKLNFEKNRKRAKKILNTVLTYLENDLNKAETAKKLGLHVNTVKYRLNKFEELTGMRVDESKNLFKTYLILKLMRLSNRIDNSN